MAKDTLSQDDREALRKAAQIIEQFRAIDSDMSIQTAATLLGVAIMEGTSLREMSDKLGIANSTASRCVSLLSKYHRMRQKGLDMVSNEIDPMERRRKIISLTAKGKAFRTKLIETMKGR